MNVTMFTYDDNSRRTATVRPNGVTSAYTYDPGSQVTSITHTGPSGTLMSFAYTYDAAGNRASVTKDGGNPETYTLDALNRLTGVTYADGTTQAYTYDANGNRLSLTVNGGAPITYTYNDADQLTSDGTSTYTYDANGNLVSRGIDTFTWDYASRMTSAVMTGVTATYSYDGEDVRVGKTVSGTPVTYSWDRECSGSGCGCDGGWCGGSCGSSAASSTGVPLLVDDGTRAYLHSEGVVAEIASSTRLDHLSDALGSSRSLTDSTSVLTGSTDYDVFGSVRASSGASSVFGFAGEQGDPDTGMLYLRARYVDAAVGRFTQADTVQPNAPGTQGWNLYTYVANNPTTWVDPTGHRVIPRRPTATEYAVLAAAAFVAAGGLQPLGQAIAATFQLLADIFSWIQDLLKTTIHWEEPSCEDKYEKCKNKCHADYPNPDDELGREGCLRVCIVTYNLCKGWPF